MISRSYQASPRIKRLNISQSLISVFLFAFSFALPTFSWQATLAIDVTTNISTRETYVGLPTVLRVVINNAVEHDVPTFPEVQGLTIEQAGPPSKNSQITSINGRRSQRTSIVYSFLVTPNEEGTFTIPPIQITADGTKTLTEAVRIVATKSETGDLLFAEISGNQSSIYVGESLELTLKFWIRPYRNEEYRVSLDEAEMWQCLSERTSWGIFEERMNELAQQRKRPGGQLVLREDSAGQEREYLLYEISTTIYPDRAKPIDAKDTRVIFNYPVELGRSRSPLDIFSNDDFFSGSPFGNSGFGSFGSRLRITQSRPLVADLSVNPIPVLPIPDKGRPASYFGAVGNYIIKTEASPTRVKMGDPITLTITIQGDGSMDVLRGPELSRQKGFNRSFKVADESMAGTISGNSKVFTTSLRPVSAAVKEIPPIEYSYFDPDREQFVTVRSRPISIQVDEAEVLALSPKATQDEAPNDEEDGNALEAFREMTNPVELFDSEEALATIPKDEFLSGKSLAALGFPPLVVAILCFYRNRKTATKLLPAGYLFRKELPQTRSIKEVNQLVESYLASRLKTKTETEQRSTLIGRLRKSGHYPLAERVERLFQTELHPGRYDLAEIRSEANQIVDGFTSSSKRLTSASQQPKSTIHSILLFAMIVTQSPLAIVQAGLSPSGERELTSLRQQRSILREGCALFSAGKKADSPSESSDYFERSIRSFESLIALGIENDKLFFNLAEAHRAYGNAGKAIANYRSALNLRPRESLYLDRLDTLEMELKFAAIMNGELDLTDGILWQDNLGKSLSLQTLGLNFWTQWYCLWLLALYGIYKKTPRIRLLITLIAFGCIASGYLYATKVNDLQDETTIVLIAPTVEVKAGNGTDFETIHVIDQAEGERLHRLQDRGDWLLVDLGKARKGWIRSADAAKIAP